MNGWIEKLAGNIGAGCGFTTAAVYWTGWLIVGLSGKLSGLSEAATGLVVCVALLSGIMVAVGIGALSAAITEVLLLEHYNVRFDDDDDDDDEAPEDTPAESGGDRPPPPPPSDYRYP